MSEKKPQLSGKTTKDLTVGSPAKNIVAFALPVMLGALFQLGYSWADAIIASEFISSEAFTAIGATAPIIFLFFSLTVGFMTGAAVVLGQFFGSKDIQNLRKAQTTILICMFVVCGVIMVAGYFLTEPLLQLLNVEEEIIGMSAAAYLKIYFLGIVTMALYNVFAQTLHAVGNSRVPLYALMVSTLTNIGLDLLFISVWNWGIEGAAVATIIAQGVSAAILFAYIQIKVPVLRLKRLEFLFSKVLFKKVIKIAFPSMMQQICAAVGFIVVSMLINKHGVDFTACFTVVNRIDEIQFVTITSFGAALTAFAAQNKGVGDIVRIKKGFWSGMWMCGGILLFTGALVLIFREALVGLFIRLETSTEISVERVLEITSQFFFVMIPSFFVVMVMFLTSGVMRGAGAAIAAMEVNIFSFAMRVAAAFLLDYYFSYYGLFFATPAAWFAGAVWAVIRYNNKKWTKVNTVVPQMSPEQAVEQG